MTSPIRTGVHNIHSTNQYRLPERQVLPEADVARFWSKVRVGSADACWLWTGSLHHNGYGQIAWLPSDPIKTRRAHCLSWVLNGGVLLSTRRVLHTCDVRHCVRWDHLYQGTPAHNSADMVRRGRAGKLRPEVVRAIRAAVGDAAVVARDFGLPHRTVYDIRTGRTWSALA